MGLGTADVLAGVGGLGCLARRYNNCGLCVLAKTAGGIPTVRSRIGVRADLGLLRKR
jgi:hypothetical protein